MTGPSSSAPPWQSPAFSELREAYASGRLVLYSGDGVSASAGLPDRKALALLLAEHARDQVSPEKLRVIHRSIAAGRCIAAFTRLFEELRWHTFVTLITEALDPDLADESEVIRSLTALVPRLRAVFDTSLAPLLERAFAGRGPAFVPALYSLPPFPSEPFLLKPYGILSNPAGWVLTRESQHRALRNGSGRRPQEEWERFFQESSVLFIGYDADDEAFLRLLSGIYFTAFKRPGPRYALVPARSVSPPRRKRLEAMGVRLIPYDDTEGRHTALAALLERLALPGAAHDTSDSRLTSDHWHAEAGELLARAGFTVSSRPPTRISPRQEVHFRWLMRSRDVPCAPVWLGRRVEAGSVGDGPLAALLTRAGPGGFTVALHAQTLSSSRELLAELARTLPPLGVAVCVYDTCGPTGPWPSGVETLGLKEVVAHRVREPLRRHASRCLSAWSEQESRFVETRARSCVSGTVRPVVEALDQTLAACSRVLLLGDFGTGKSTHLRHFAACLARDFLEDREGARAPLLLPLAGLPADLDVLIARHVPELSRPLFRLAVELGLVVSLLDGLDELKREPTPRQDDLVEPTLLRLRQVFSQGEARTIFTSRAIFFAGPLPISQGRLLGVPSRGHLTLEPLDRSEVHALVERWAPSREARARLEERLRRSPHLEALAERPALLELFLKHPEPSPARLYALATEAWLGSRDGQEHRVEREPQLRFARRLARTLLDKGLEKIQRRVLYEDVFYREMVRLELRTVGFLGHSAPSPSPFGANPSDEDPEAELFDRFEQNLEVRLPNSSFLEYFLAVDIGEELAAGRVETLARGLLPAGVRSFVVEQEGWERGRELLRGVLATEYTREVSENALVLLHQDARTRVGEGAALGRLLVDELPVGARLEGARLEEVELPWVFLREARLSGAMLTGARLEFADLRGARLDYAQAERARFDGALLDRASFEGAWLQRASMLDASVERVEWKDANRDELLLLEAGAGGPPLAVLHGWLAPGRVSVAWSPDGRRMASGHAGGSVRVWDADSGKLLLRLEGVQATGEVAFSPDGLRLASVYGDGTVRVWDARGGLPLHRLEVHASPVRKVMFSPSPDDELLVTACEDGTVVGWDMRGGVLRYRLEGSEQWGESVEFSPSGFLLAHGCTDGTMTVRNAESGKLLHQLEGHAGGVKGVAFSRDGVFLASGSEDGTVRIWNMLRRHSPPRHRPLQHRLEVGAGAVHTLSSSRWFLAVGCEDGTVGVWDLAEGARAHQWGEHVGPVRRVRISPDSWPTPESQEEQVPRVHVASIGEDRTVRLWDTAGGDRMHRLLEREVEATSLEFSPDGERLAVGFAEGAVKVWDLESGKVLHAVEAPRRGPRRVAVSPDGEQLACLIGDGAVSVWDVCEGRRLHRLAGDSGWVETGLARGWEARTVALLRRLEDPEGGDEVEVSSPDGERLFSLSAEGLVRVSRRGGETRTVVLASTKDGWVAQVEGTPFVASEGDASRLFHYVGGTTGTMSMPAELWKPLFHQPDLVREALEGRRVDPEEWGLGSSAACVSALRTERRRLGLERRRGGSQPD